MLIHVPTEAAFPPFPPPPTKKKKTHPFQKGFQVKHYLFPLLQELMDQVKYLKLEKNIKNGTVRSHAAGKNLKMVTVMKDLH